MILAAVEIENYKQYAGSHCIDFPEQGMVAITGPNGAGKTTLFEAIEWCLYGPRTIPHASIPPHGGVGATRVSVTLQDPHDGRRYVVKRTLRNGVSAAEAYSEDDPGQPLVQGPRDVSDYVAKQLVGLPHAAFVSTFFTRQKELTLFRRPDPDRSPGRGGASAGISDRPRRAGRDWDRAHPGATGGAVAERPVRGRLRRVAIFTAEIASAEATLDEAREREAGAAQTLVRRGDGGGTDAVGARRLAKSAGTGQRARYAAGRHRGTDRDGGVPPGRRHRRA